MKKVIVRIKGGLGNQLFCYAAARRLSLVNGAELVIDDVTGFVRDSLYHSKYLLDRFSISARKATPAERLEPFERYRRGINKLISRCKPFANRFYVEQEGDDSDARILSLEVNKNLYLDGYWQSEDYFKDVEGVIRKDLRITPPLDGPNQRMAEDIKNSCSVALHVRWFDAPDQAQVHNVAVDYYRRAIAFLEEKLKSPRYFVFSNDPEAARKKIDLPESRVICVSHNKGNENACADLWLMTLCRNFIIANSTFSWWGAWLAESDPAIVVVPNINVLGGAAWAQTNSIPCRWVRI